MGQIPKPIVLLSFLSGGQSIHIMVNRVSRLFGEGCRLIEPIMDANGFHWEAGRSGTASGGSFASGQYVKDDRRLELHFRRSLGLVIYHIGAVSLSHDAYMRHVAGCTRAHYPGFSSDPLDGFVHLAHDLRNFGADFLSGSGQAFQKAKQRADARSKLSRFEQVFGGDDERDPLSAERS